jgi:fibronectin-binding autotransporter adhesin
VTQTSGTNAALDFTTYGAGGVGVANYTSTNLGLSGGGDIVNNTATSPIVSANPSAYALKTAVATDLGGANHTLTLGNGSGQAGLIVNDGGSVFDGNITFGGAEGLVHVSGTTTIGSAGNTITGNGLLSFTGSGSAKTTINNTITDNGGQPVKVAITGVGTSFTLNGANSYSGGTLLSVIGTVSVGTDTAFGTGKVTNILGSSTGAPWLQALNGTRTLANAFDLYGDLEFVGTNSVVLTGPINIIHPAAAGTRMLANAIGPGGLTVGTTPGSSTITLGNPVSNGGDGIGKGLTLSLGTNSTTTINAVIQDPAAGGGAASGNLSIATSGTVALNGVNTYTGGTP